MALCCPAYLILIFILILIYVLIVVLTVYCSGLSLYTMLSSSLSLSYSISSSGPHLVLHLPFYVSSLVLSCRVLSCPVLSCLVLSLLVLSCSVLSYLVLLVPPPIYSIYLSVYLQPHRCKVSDETMQRKQGNILKRISSKGSLRGAASLSLISLNYASISKGMLYSISRPASKHSGTQPSSRSPVHWGLWARKTS